MSDLVKYEHWPTMAKIGTALSNEKFVVTSHKLSRYVGWVLVILGLLEVGYDIFRPGSSGNYEQYAGSFAFILIGGFNVFYSYYIKWINDNSSWEERFANSSSMSHRIINLLISVLMIIALVVYFKSL